MIVAHPDDETFWGGATLASESGWGVICLSHRSNRFRRRAFRRATQILKVPATILNLPDRKEQEVPAEDLAWIADRLKVLVNADHVKQVMTHGPDGEYGHPLHRGVNSVVTSICEEPDRLWYFNFDESSDLEAHNQAAWDLKMQAAACYLGPNHLDWDPNDYRHMQMGRYESPVKARDYQRPADLFRRVYEHDGPG